MEGTNMPPNNMPPSNMPPSRPSNTSASGSSMWVWLIVGVVVLAGLAYFWNARSGGDPVINSIENQGNSDEVLDIEADLEATDVDSVDYNLDEENYNAS